MTIQIGKHLARIEGNILFLDLLGDLVMQELLEYMQLAERIASVHGFFHIIDDLSQFGTAPPEVRREVASWLGTAPCRGIVVYGGSLPARTMFTLILGAMRLMGTLRFPAVLVRNEQEARAFGITRQRLLRLFEHFELRLQTRMFRFFFGAAFKRGAAFAIETPGGLFFIEMIYESNKYPHYGRYLRIVSADVDGDGKLELLLAQKNFLRAVVLKRVTDSLAGQSNQWTWVVKDQVNGSTPNSRIVGATPLPGRPAELPTLCLLDADRKFGGAMNWDGSATDAPERRAALEEFTPARSPDRSRRGRDRARCGACASDPAG